MLVAGALVAAGVLSGGGFAVQQGVATAANVEATRQLTDSHGLDHSQLDAYAGIAAARAQRSAEITITVANEVLGQASGKVDAESLSSSIASLGSFRELDVGTVADLTQQTKAAIAETRAAVAEHDAAAEAAARNTPEGAKAYARDLAASSYGWHEEQFQCLHSLWTKESNWRYDAVNPSSGATGIPQSLPGSKMATAGADWQTNAATQVTWGLSYIERAYGTPCSAWSHSQSMNWY